MAEINNNTTISQKKKRKQTSYSKWSDAKKFELIEMRTKYDHMYTGKNANQNEGWRKISDQLIKPVNLCKQQWQALLRKYKILINKPTGSFMSDDEDSPLSWPFYEVLHKYASKKHNFRSSILSNSEDGVVRQDANRTSDYTSSSCSVPLIVPESSSSIQGSSSTRTSRSRAEGDLIKESKKIGRKISSTLTIFGQIVAKQYPEIDVSSMLISESDYDS